MINGETNALGNVSPLYPIHEVIRGLVEKMFVTKIFSNLLNSEDNNS